MPRFLVDEDLPRSLCRELRRAGYLAEDARDVGLRGRPDDDVFEYCRAQGLTLVSGEVLKVEMTLNVVN